MDQSVFDDLQIGQKIGNGAFSQVFKGRYMGQEVAVKVLVKKAFEQYRSEIEILEQLDHENIVKLITSRFSSTQCLIVQEYIQGCTLSELLKTQRLTQDEIKHIIRQLLMVVSYLHQLNITHRDLKPDNIMVAQDMKIKIIDFGLSQQSEMKVSYEKCGTLLYMAPEMILRQPYLKSVDIWSCGIIQYELYHNHHPYWNGQPDVNAYIEALKHEVQFTSMDKYAQHFFKKCASSNPDDRLSADQALQHPWLTGVGDLNTPITMADMMTLFEVKQRFLRIIQASMLIREIFNRDDYQFQIRTLIIPLPTSDGSIEENNDNTTTEEQISKNFIFKISRSGSRTQSFIKHVRSTSSLFVEATHSPNKKQQLSPFRQTQKPITSKFQHSFSLQIQKRNSVSRLPPLNNSNSPVNLKKSTKKINLQFKMMN